MPKAGSRQVWLSYQNCDNSISQEFLKGFVLNVRESNLIAKCDRLLLQSASCIAKC